MALSERCLPAHSLNLKGVPRRGEQCSVENNSYKGYSPPKCTWNAFSHIQVKTYILTDSLTHAYAKCENRHLCSINDHFFPNKSFLCYNQNPFDLSKFRVFIHLWATDFRFLTAGRRMPFRNFNGLSPLVIMSNHN